MAWGSGWYCDCSPGELWVGTRQQQNLYTTTTKLFFFFLIWWSFKFMIRRINIFFLATELTGKLWNWCASGKASAVSIYSRFHCTTTSSQILLFLQAPLLVTGPGEKPRQPWKWKRRKSGSERIRLGRRKKQRWKSRRMEWKKWGLRREQSWRRDWNWSREWIWKREQRCWRDWRGQGSGERGKRRQRRKHNQSKEWRWRRGAQTGKGIEMEQG